MSSELVNSEQDFVFYQSEDGDLKVQVIVDPATETIWATQKAMADLFQLDVSGISRHINSIYSSGELDENTTIAKIATVVQRGFRGASSGQRKMPSSNQILIF